MRSVRGPVVLCFVAAVAVGVSAETTQLNPTVTVVPRPQSSSPSDCDVGLAPAPPRPVATTATTTTTTTRTTPTTTPTTTIVEEQQPATVTVTDIVPPSGDLRTHLRRIQSAAENEDYQSFKTALSDARLALSGYPRGGERQAAEEVMQVYGDLEHLWDYAYNTPTGAFFDVTSQNGALVNMMRRYPAFPRAVASSTLNISGQTLYPSRETRLLLVDEASRRLTRLGVRTPGRVIIERPPIRQPRQPTRVVIRDHRVTAPKAGSTHRKRTPIQIASGTGHPNVTKRAPAQRVQPTTHRQAKAPTTTTPPPVTHTVAPPPTTTAAIPPNVTTQPPVTATTAAPPPTQTETTATTAPPTTTSASTATTDTTATTATASTTTAPAARPTGRGGMNLVFAIILIIIGIGVLIVLFRASD